MNQNVLNDFTKVLIKNKYKNKIQELKLEYCTNEQDNYITLNVIRIKTSQQNKGYGSMIMNDIIQLADTYNVKIKLFATNLWGADLKRLYRFYEKQGFVRIKNKFDIGKLIYFPKNKLIVVNVQNK
ncbi:MAG: GNAT family N-acetyltransferase [Candidatus Paceibacterota bacterium]